MTRCASIRTQSMMSMMVLLTVTTERVQFGMTRCASIRTQPRLS